jgi:hypothetical protein
MASFGAEMKVIQNLCEVFCQTSQWCRTNKRHFEANHPHASSKPRAYFERLLDSKKNFPKKLRSVFLFLTTL